MPPLQPNDPLLIALLPHPADLVRAQAGWYRVPLSHAPPTLATARALAFYQPASFGEARWRIEWWAAVQGLRQCPRRALLPDEPDHPRADEPYIVADLGPPQPVEPAKCASKGRRLLFLPTTWAAFQAAASVEALLDVPERPIADDLLYRLIQQQIEGVARQPAPPSGRQRRLFEAPPDDESPDW